MQNLLKDKNKSCFICSKQFDVTRKENGRSVKILTTPCNHLFHRVCLRNWFRNEANGNFCQHCKQTMEWRDATPLGKENTTTDHSSRSNSQSETEVTVQSLETEIRQRKAKELLHKKEAAERAKFELSEEQRAEAQERRRLRREARNAVLAEQNTKTRKISIIIFVLIGTVSLSLTSFTNNSMDVAQQQNNSVVPALQRLEQGEQMWQQKLTDIKRQINFLEREIDNYDHHGKYRNEMGMKKYELEKEQKTAENMLSWYHSDVAQETLDIFGHEMEELIDLASKVINSEAEAEEFFKRDREIFRDLDAHIRNLESEGMDPWNE